MERIVLALLHDRVQVGVGKPGAGVYKLCQQRLGRAGGAAEWEDAVRYLWKRHRLPRGRVLLVLPGALSGVCILSLPSMRRRRLARAVQDEMRYREEREIVADYVPIGRDALGAWRVLACACLREDLRWFIEMMERLGLRMAGITVPVEPAFRLLCNTGVMQGQSCVLLFFDGAALLSILAERGVCRYAAYRALWAEPGAPDAASGVIGAVSEILRLQTKQEPNAPPPRVYYAGCAGDDFKAYVSGLQKLGLQTAPLPQCERIRRFPQGERMGDWLMCAGGMLR